MEFLLFFFLCIVFSVVCCVWLQVRLISLCSVMFGSFFFFVLWRSAEVFSFLSPDVFGMIIVAFDMWAGRSPDRACFRWIGREFLAGI